MTFWWILSLIFSIEGFNEARLIQSSPKQMTKYDWSAQLTQKKAVPLNREAIDQQAKMNREKPQLADGQLLKKIPREKQKERAFSGKYLYEEQPGTYVCATCKNPLFLSKDKYDSGSGWPSFKKTIHPKSVYYLADMELGFLRYEVLCRKCDRHLGHVFNDGPPPKGLRYCIHSISLKLQ